MPSPSQISFTKPNIPAYLNEGFTVFDMHTHTNFSDGKRSVDQMLLAAKKLKIGICITDHNEIKGNYVGTDITGNFAIPNQIGIGIGSLVTGTLVDGNIISGNSTFGLVLTDNTDSNLVVNNLVGTTSDGTSNLGNRWSGIALSQGAKNNRIGDFGQTNKIAYNDSAGVVLMDNTTIGNKISANSIYDNDYLGIDIYPWGINQNDAGDADIGPNDMMNFPEIVSTGYNAGNGLTYITGTLSTQNPENASVEIFKASPDLLFSCGEGKTYLGSTVPDASGNWAKVVTGIVSGDDITTTTIGANGSTSEFSQYTSVVTGIENESSSILNISVHPNPANSFANINYFLPESSYVKVVLVDVVGKKVFSFFEGDQNPGMHSLGVDLNENNIPTGVYFVKFSTNKIEYSILKMEVVK